MPYRYETHLHTSAASACAVARARDYIPLYRDLGYHGLIVTDHFFGGNTAVDRSLPWREQVDWFCAGYEEARNEGEKRGVQVLFGWEQAFAGDEYLVYGLSKEWLYAHPEVTRWSRAEQFAQAHRYGGCVVQAHPFRERYYIRRIRLNAVCVDGVEVLNAANSPEENALAYRYAKALGLPMLGGSDIHTTQNDTFAGVVFPTPLADEHDLANRLRAKAPMALYGAPQSEARLAARLAGTAHLPVEILGADGQATDRTLDSLLLGGASRKSSRENPAG